MGSLQENEWVWDGHYDWSRAGEEWSDSWGGSYNQWLGMVYPRIARFLPTGTILEIAPGYGRWTQYLREHTDFLIGVDLSGECVNACRERFEDDPRLTFHQNDGTSLEMIDVGTVDFVFSLDSLVHVEDDVIRAYLQQIATKLRADGVGFIHHSNAGRYRRYFEQVERRLPKRVRDTLFYGRAKRLPLCDNVHWRALSMTAARFRELCDQAGLACISQEEVTWGTRRMIDCFSVFASRRSRWIRPTQMLENRRLMDEAKVAKRRGGLYAPVRLTGR